MKIMTTKFGEIEIDKEAIIKFPEGILGFEEINEYAVMDMEEGNPLKWLQAVKEPALTFIIISPFQFRPNYSVNISDKDTEELKLETAKDSEIFAIVVVPDNPSKMTANLQGPLVVNIKEKIGRQVISTNPRHKIKHFILEEMQANLSQGGK